MKVGVYSLQKVLFQGTASALHCKTANGEITILDHHRPLFSVLESGVIKVTDTEGRDHYVQVASGFLEVTQTNESRCIVD